MKQSKEYDLVQEQMKPGVLTHTGFLGRDKRKLMDIIEADGEAVKRLRLTHSKIAARLREFRTAGMAGLGTPVSFEQDFEVRVEGARGKLPCPFLHKGLFQKNMTIIINSRTGSEFSVSDLAIHLIEEHGFYQGTGSPYRLDPEILAKELSIRI